MRTDNRRGGLTAAISALPLLLLLAAPALAGPLADAATKAEALAASGDTLGAHDLLRSATGAFSSTLPFSIGKAVFVGVPPVGYAMYEPKPQPIFKPGEALVSYVEPIGLTWTPAAAGKVQTHFTVDLDILSASGEVLANQKAFGDFTFTSFFRNQEIYATLTTDVSGAAAGDYVLRFHFNDLNSGKSASVDQKFTIAAMSPTP
ncbi:hypothetical protein LJR098_002607 [Rhizobium sp. LjRoot98]|uniref:hypothetical protein n=1 Tax=unclassified Rhizobium TaxID=2613769 RepID=UPI000713D00A|nr:MULTISPECIES: hypothetical protein [unclassified Rhizobium]KQV31283.1 hypothetical protein ASC96_08890 [Rhizobium sp. Root1204]KQY10765.1 hypothetical protein ASD36_08560 [Rhizobium sp. Root1334]KRC04752.1 hypothetical protein ASE23_06330 [Rhizobium sp. Root73]